LTVETKKVLRFLERSLSFCRSERQNIFILFTTIPTFEAAGSTKTLICTKLQDLAFQNNVILTFVSENALLCEILRFTQRRYGSYNVSTGKYLLNTLNPEDECTRIFRNVSNYQSKRRNIFILLGISSWLVSKQQTCSEASISVWSRGNMSFHLATPSVLACKYNNFSVV
jgi:hypothetical protein